MFHKSVEFAINAISLKNGFLSTTEHLEQVIEHEPSCFKNHSRNPQVRFLIQVVMTCNAFVFLLNLYV